MKRIILNILVCAFTAAVLIFCFYMPQIFKSNDTVKNKSVSLNSDKTEYAGEYDIIAALMDADEWYSGSTASKGKKYTEEEIIYKLSLIEKFINDNYGKIDFIVEEVIPFITSRERNIWMCKISSNSENVTLVFDENTDKFVSFRSDVSVLIYGAYYTYESLYKKEYTPDSELLNEAYGKIEELIFMLSSYYEVTVDEVYFDHFMADRYNFYAELYDEKRNTVTVNVSYNISTGRYNFNF